MTCKEALLQIIQRQTEGLMYHDEMTDYYAFLNLGVLKKLHRKQTEEELEALRKAKCDYISTFGMIPFYTANDPKAIPSDWRNKTNAEVDEQSLKLLIQSSLLGYVSWEEDTCDIYKTSAQAFKENMNSPLYRKACDMIEEVQKEICKVNQLLLDAASYDYCPSYFK
jgi:hypothetical protein